MKKLTTDIAITPKVLMDKPKRNILPYPFNMTLIQVLVMYVAINGYRMYV